MPRIDVDGISIAYELIGDGDKLVVITPGGRFSKDTPGVRELAEELAGSGYAVAIWDRPNCGESDVCFDGECESFQNADALGGLVRAIGKGPALLVGASGGARETLLAAIRHADVVAGAFVQWLSGGAIGIATLPITYCADSAIAAATGGMAAVADLPAWQEQLSRRPENRDRILALDPEAFVETLRAWAEYFLPQPGVPIPCVSAAQLAAIGVPVMVLRSGASDIHHSRLTSETVAAMIPTATLAEPPWGDHEWMDRLGLALSGAGPLFGRLPLLAPQIVAFAAAHGHV